MSTFHRAAKAVSGSLCALAISLAVQQPLHAQNLNGLFDLMGRAIEHDMERQRYQRQQREQEEQYDRERRQRAEVEQAHADRIREQEIALIKRLQTALSELGFYSAKIDGDRGPGTQAAESAFSAAFNLGAISLVEGHVQEVERIASRGFRNNAEAQAAEARGFESRGEQDAADRAGFEDGYAFRKARGLGFASAQEYERYVVSDFETPEAFRAAELGGFTDADDFEAARAAGFGSKSEFDAFVASGLEDRSAFQKMQTKIAAAAERVTLCAAAVDGDDMAASVAACLEAVAALADGPRNPDLTRALNAVTQKLDAQHESAVKALAPVEVTNNDNTIGAGTFLASQAAAADLRARHVCGLAVWQERWVDADVSCAHIDDTSFPFPELRQLAAVKAKEARLAADKEQRQTAMEAAQRRAEGLLDDIAEYAQDQRKLGQPILIAKAIVVIRENLSSDDYRQIEQAASALEELLRSEIDFQEFLASKLLADQVGKVNARATAEAELRRSRDFIEHHVAANLLSPAVEPLLRLQTSIDEGLVASNDERLFAAQAHAKGEFARLELSGALANFLPVEATSVAPEIETADNGIAITDDNRPLLEGDLRDVLLLGNFTAAAPNLVVNLLGGTIFEDGEARYCWYGGQPNLAELEERAVEALGNLGVEQSEAAPSCETTSSDAIDVVFLERGKLLASSALEAQPLIAAFERKQMRTIAEVSWAAIGAQAERHAEISKAIVHDLDAGIRDGFGFVRLPGEYGVCLAVSELEHPMHELVLKQQSSGSIQDALGIGVIRTDGIERSFTALQRKECSVAYADAKDLKLLIEGLRNIGQTFDVFPVWITSEMLRLAALEVVDKEKQLQKRLADAAQETEANRKLADAQIAEDNVRRNEAQRQLRIRYQQEANAAIGTLSDTGHQYLTNISSDSDFAMLFPSVAKWKADHLGEGWSIDDVDTQLNDYGTALWKGRRLEAVFANMRIISANSVLGEYTESCYTAGYLIDGEFGVLRDPVVAPCDEAESVLTAWKRGRDYESRWIMHP
jgi:hypothetical protein